MPTGIHHPVTFTLQGKGYAVTGTTSSSSYTNDVYQYDPVMDTWTSLTDFPGFARSYSIGLAYDGIGYLGFGSKGQDDYLNDLWSFDPQSGTWTELESCPCLGRAHPAMIALNGKIYVGLGNNTFNRRDWWEYDISADSWTQMADLPGPTRHHPYQFAAGGNVYAGMGHGNGIFNDWYKLDTLTNSWIAMNDFPGEARVAGTQFDHDGFGYVLSGDGDNHSFMATGEFWRYNPQNDTWTQLTPHSGISRWAPGSFVIDDEVYFFGGVNRELSSYPDVVEKFDLSTVGLGIDDPAALETAFYPNPAVGYIELRLGEELQAGFLQIISITGQTMLTEDLIGIGQKVDVSTLAQGTYVIMINDKGRLIAREILVKE